MIEHRFTEACAMLPMLHLSASKANCVLCVGPFAEALAAYCMRWRDVARVLLLEDPIKLRDRRVEVVDTVVPGTCDAVIVSPDTDPVPFSAALAKDGVLCASTGYQGNRAADFYARMRRAFRRIKPWREHLPGPLYGVLVSPGGPPTRLRDPPGSARRLNTQYLPSLFVFGTDEVPFVFGSAKTGEDAEPSIKDDLLCSI